MAREIAEQPATLAATLAGAREARTELRRLAQGAERVLFFGRGSSANAATYGQHLCVAVAQRPAEVGAPSTATLYDAHLDLADTLVVLLSQSGRTSELVEVAAWSRRRAAGTVAVTNDPGSPLAAAVDVVLPVAAGRERAVPATKTYTGQLAALAALVDSLWPGSSLDGIDAAPEEAQRLLEIAAGPAEEVAELLVPAAGLVVTGRGPTLTTAQELALKAQETCRLLALPFSAADLQHGPVALLGPDVPLLVAATGSPTLPGLAAVARSAAERGSPVVVQGGDESLWEVSRARLPAPDLAPALTPIVGVLPGQLVVERLAHRLGHDPDAPRGLAKVTQTS